jgi:hypothetical protein
LQKFSHSQTGEVDDLYIGESRNLLLKARTLVMLPGHVTYQGDGLQAGHERLRSAHGGLKRLLSYHPGDARNSSRFRRGRRIGNEDCGHLGPYLCARGQHETQRCCSGRHNDAYRDVPVLFPQIGLQHILVPGAARTDQIKGLSINCDMLALTSAYSLVESG